MQVITEMLKGVFRLDQAVQRRGLSAVDNHMCWQGEEKLAQGAQKSFTARYRSPMIPRRWDELLMAWRTSSLGNVT